MNSGIAAEGYVVIGSMAGFRGYCFDESKDQVRNIEWARTDPTYSTKVDWTKKVGVTGHSMGGGATLNTVGNA